MGFFKDEKGEGYLLILPLCELGIGLCKHMWKKVWIHADSLHLNVQPPLFNAIVSLRKTV